jgi:hypothetical protein
MNWKLMHHPCVKGDGQSHFIHTKSPDKNMFMCCVVVLTECGTLYGPLYLAKNNLKVSHYHHVYNVNIRKLENYPSS